MTGTGDVGDPIGALLATTRTIAVVGLSSDPAKESHQIADYLQQAGYTIWPVNPNADRVLGLPSYPGLDTLPAAPDVVQVFRPPADVPAIVEAAIRVGAKVVWMQVGIRHDEAAARAEAAGLTVLMDACMRRQHRLPHDD